MGVHISVHRVQSIRHDRGPAVDNHPDRTTPLHRPGPRSKAAFGDQDTEPINVIRRRRTPPVQQRVRLIVGIVFIVGFAAIAAWGRPHLPATSARNVAPTVSPLSTGETTIWEPTPRPTSTPMSSVAPLDDRPTMATLTTEATTPLTGTSPTSIAEVPATSTISPTETQQTDSATGTPSPSPVVSRSELVENGGFEEGDLGWSLDVGGGAAALNAHNGHYAMILGADGGSGRQKVRVAPEASYRLSVWCFVGAANDSGRVTILFVGKDGEQIKEFDPIVLNFATTHYAKRSVIFDVPPDVSSIIIVVEKPDGSGIMAVDDVSLRRVTYPAVDAPAE